MLCNCSTVHVEVYFDHIYLNLSGNKQPKDAEVNRPREGEQSVETCLYTRLRRSRPPPRLVLSRSSADAHSSGGGGGGGGGRGRGGAQPVDQLGVKLRGANHQLHERRRQQQRGTHQCGGGGGRVTHLRRVADQNALVSIN